MGVMTLFIGEEYIVGTGQHGDIDTVISTVSVCEGVWSLQVVCTSSLWVEFDLSDAFCTVTRADNDPFVNGETLTGNREYIISITGFQSLAGQQNTTESQVVCTVKNTELGAEINSSEMTRLHAGLNCN
tara:strand:+ start:212 stop:598 length:387 start_codon:yes stop_codon:yes gene_type:complete